MNLAQARTNMINGQLRTRNVVDEDIVDVIAATAREHFVPEAYKNLAYCDSPIPLAHGQAMMKPSEEALMLQALAIQPGDNILEIGTGSGYITALLAQLGKHVYSVDLFPEFSQAAQEKCQALDLDNISFITTDAAEGWADQRPYDVIAITGGLPFLPKPYRSLLNPGGRLFAILGEAPAMTATLFTRLERTLEPQPLFETVVAPLINAPTKERFTL